MGGGIGLAARALSQSQRQRRGLAQARCATSASAGRCRWRSIASEINQVIYLGLAKPSNNTIMPQSGAVQARVCDQVGDTTIPSSPTSCSTRSGSTKRDAEGIRLLPDGRAGDHRGRAPERAVRGHRHAAADRRAVEEGRPEDADQAADARELPPARLLGRGGDDRLCRHHDGRRRRPTPAPRSSRRPCWAACNGRAGACTSRARASRARRATWPTACQLLDLLQQWETRDQRRGPPRGVGEDPDDQRRRRCSRSAR